jgi:acetyltransferase-like isoleucine patch superfamily enzyme
MIINILLKNPFSLWLRWIMRTLALEWRHRKRHIKIGYLSTLVDCRFGVYNTIYDHVVLDRVELGDFSYISSYSLAILARIGKFSAISDHVTCGLGLHPSYDFVSIHPIFYSRKNQAQISFADKDFVSEYKPVDIGHDVWIGSHVMIMGGITVGNGAIIGAGSVVTKDVPPYAIVGGVPAKLIRYRFNERQIHFLQKFEWWNKDISWLREHYRDLHDINEFMKKNAQ